MFSAVLGLFSQDLAVDLGSSETRIYMRGSGVVIAEPTVVAVRTDCRGRRSVLAIGADARPMLGRTPAGIDVCEPVQGGQIANFEVAQALLTHLVRRAHGRNNWLRPRIALTVADGATDAERRATREACEAAGARLVHLVPRPLASALGAGLPVYDARAHLVVDIGAGHTEVGLISCRQVVRSEVIPGGGTAMDHAIQQWLHQAEDLLVGAPSVRRIRETLASALPPRRPQRCVIRGRCARQGLPRAVEVDAVDIHAAISPTVDAIAAGIRRVVEGAPPELAADIGDHGAVVTGGGALLPGIEGALRERTRLSVVAADRPRTAAIRGAGAALERVELLEAARG